VGPAPSLNPSCPPFPLLPRQFCRALGIAGALTRHGPLSAWATRYAGELVARRSAWFDRVLAGALDAGATQVVLLAAGYDSSAYRLARPGVRFFEVDLPPVSAAKRGLVAAALPGLAPSALPTYIGADLAAVPLGEALAPAGFDPAARTLWVAQGLFMYLAPEATSRLICQVRALSAPGSRLACDLVNAAWSPDHPVAAASLFRGVAERGEPMLCAVRDATAATLAALGEAHGFALRSGAVGRDVRGAVAAPRGAPPTLPTPRIPALLHDVIACAEFETA
jgi:methyltransferase (TIGR00027 family)